MQFLIHDMRFVFDKDSGLIFSLYDRYKNTLFLNGQKFKIIIVTIFCIK